MTVCLSAYLVCVCVPALCVCPLQQQQQSANLPMNALGPSLGPQLASSQTPLHSTPPPAASSASTAGGATNLPHPQPSSRSSTPTLPGPAPAPGATPPRPTQPQPQAELPAAAQTQPPPQPPTTPVRLRTSACPALWPRPLPPSANSHPSWLPYTNPSHPYPPFLPDNCIFTTVCSIHHKGIVTSFNFREQWNQYGSCSSLPWLQPCMQKKQLSSCQYLIFIFLLLYLSLCVSAVSIRGQSGQPGAHAGLSRQRWPALAACRSRPACPGGQSRTTSWPTGVWGRWRQNWAQDGGGLKLCVSVQINWCHLSFCGFMLLLTHLCILSNDPSFPTFLVKNIKCK